METKDYKQEIINTRKGCLGSSDGRMIAQIATMGYVPKSAYDRLATLKGLKEPKDGFKTNAMIFGDIIENTIYDQLKSSTNKDYQSNPLWESEKYSGRFFKLISHPDIVLADADSKTLFVYEVKTTKDTWKATRDSYKAQLYIHTILAKELREEGWKVRVMLVTYDTNGLDLDNPYGIEFDSDRMTISEVRFPAPPFNIRKAITIIDDFLKDFNEYYGSDDVDADLLPVNVKNEFDKITTILSEIKEREAQVDDFKQRLYNFMVEKDIKSVKNDSFSITRVDPTESKSVDYKSFFEEYEQKYPRKARKAKEQYAKITKRKGYSKITIKNETNG